MTALCRHSKPFSFVIPSLFPLSFRAFSPCHSERQRGIHKGLQIASAILASRSSILAPRFSECGFFTPLRSVQNDIKHIASSLA
ncbi:MAG: hypothetical protein NZM06_03935, partial [Chloroherpetonaceae bacterium]|nr:hypothetical protein [Chloroherpetonaceae bacterium]